MVLTDTPNTRAASPAERNFFFFICSFYTLVSIFVNAFIRSQEVFIAGLAAAGCQARNKKDVSRQRRRGIRHLRSYPPGQFSIEISVVAGTRLTNRRSRVLRYLS